MEPPRFANKENLFELKVCQMNSSLMPPPHLLSVPQNMLKKSQPKAKPQKGFAANVRAGDWVCLRCKNLNFAFRSECNRCQLQVKDQNKFLTFSSPENTSPTESMQKRVPFKDLTNLQCLISSQASSEALLNKDVYSNDRQNSNPSVATQSVTVMKSQVSNNDNLPIGPNKGFNHMLLVTPPKRNQNKDLSFLHEDSDLIQNELPPYKSPKHLPSIASMLEQVIGDRRPLCSAEERITPTQNISQDSHQLMNDSGFFHFEKCGIEPEFLTGKQEQSLAHHD